MVVAVAALHQVETGALLLDRDVNEDLVWTWSQEQRNATPVAGT